MYLAMLQNVNTKAKRVWHTANIVRGLLWLSHGVRGWHMMTSPLLQLY